MIEELDASLWLGELDISNITQFEAALEELLWRPANIVVDMTETEFIDSTTLHVLTRTQEQLPGRFAVVIPQESVINRVFSASGYDKKLPIFRTPEDALAALR